MKVIHKHSIPIQECQMCKSAIKITYKDLRPNGYSLSNKNWKCPLCRYEQRVEFARTNEEYDIKSQTPICKPIPQRRDV